jgi:hypothetical protein
MIPQVSALAKTIPQLNVPLFQFPLRSFICHHVVVVSMSQYQTKDESKSIIFIFTLGMQLVLFDKVLVVELSIAKQSDGS